MEPQHTMHSQSAGGNHRFVIFRCDNQPTITAQWYSGTIAQSATTSMIALDLFGVTTQSADHNASSIRASIKFRLNISASPTLYACATTKRRRLGVLLQNKQISQHRPAHEHPNLVKSEIHEPYRCTPKLTNPTDCEIQKFEYD
ncbi:cyclin family protein [Dorcoceras hygrometricum]|uniref:Cyclin family protein n=1 Tax=Dorcoceras hygrometricum TaxID=472368 RepID=A0A2Z7D1D3_9LAMI|nr:cyclin family protein [Dorcoceras hygrometricum]